VTFAISFTLLLVTLARTPASAASDLSLCEALERYSAVSNSIQHAWNAAQDLALSPRMLPLLRAIRRHGPLALRDFWTSCERHYAQGVARLRNAGLDDPQLQAIAQWDISNRDNAATTMIEAAHPSSDVMHKVNPEFDQWQRVVYRFKEPRLRGTKLSVLRSEMRDCSVS
jgi:hypothetical protein